MGKLTSYLTRKAEVLAQRRNDYTSNPPAATIQIKASSQVAGTTGARPIQMGNHNVLSDAAPGLAGHALGPSAPELLLGALASCLVHTYLIHAALLNLPLDHVIIEVTAALDMTGVVGLPYSEAPRLQTIQYVATVEMDALPDALEKLHEVVEKTCPVLNTLKYGVGVTRG